MYYCICIITFYEMYLTIRFYILEQDLFPYLVFIEIVLIYNVVLVSGVMIQLYIYISIHIIIIIIFAILELHTEVPRLGVEWEL